ncbi:hypothetical protein IWW55_003274 [Coemansia sp. RSA 2706]|nr:hypothetical protein LPJ63_003864 [Coemansia sp. RSA 2711]KAJ1849718.1 hypothetical protein LPJ70_000287 [Coemansia sp. RSA 2708]KAJ2302737.1 hypothetical protein IWW55_003274 [Coemansia sp. RSA 2706]
MFATIKRASKSAIRAVKLRRRRHTHQQGTHELPYTKLEAVALELAQEIVRHGILADELAQVNSKDYAALQRREDAASVY